MRSNLADRVACARRGWLAPVVVAKLDRLGRDHLHFISGLVAQKTPFLVADLGPDVEPFLLHLKAALTEKERAVISQRTKAALAAAKARGVELGGPTGLPPKVTPEQRAKGSAATAQLARDFAERLRPVLAGLDGQCGGPGVSSAAASARPMVASGPRRRRDSPCDQQRRSGRSPRRSRLASKRFLAIRGRNVRHQPAKRRPRARMLTVLRSTGLWQ